MKLPVNSALLGKPEAVASLVRELAGVSVIFLLCLAIGAGFPTLSVAQETEKPLIVLIGQPGSGKSTQATSIQKRYGFAVITREQLMADDPSVLARNKQPDIDGIGARSDPALNQLFLKRLEQTDISRGLLLDGYPATKGHADFLSEVILKKGLSRPLVLLLDVPDEIARQRLKGEPSERIEQDLKDYHREMDFIAVYFPESDIARIDGTKDAGAVFREIRRTIQERLKK